MLDLILDWLAVLFPTVLSVAGVLVSIKAPQSHHHRAWRISLIVGGVLISAATFWHQSRARTAHEIEITSLNSKILSLGNKVGTIQTLQEKETTRREQAERDLAIIIHNSSKATREGIASDIKKSPIQVQVNTTRSETAPLQVEEIKVIPSPERSTHTDAPYGAKWVLISTTPVNLLRLTITCAAEIQYLEWMPAKGAIQYYGDIRIFENDKTKVIVSLRAGTGLPVLAPDAPLVVHLAAAKPIVMKSIERGPKD